MRGHTNIVAMRRQGLRPLHVTLHNLPRSTRWWAFPELHPFPDVAVEADDVPERIDLRFVVGLPVFVDIDEDEQRMRRLVLAAEKAGASHVIGHAWHRTGPESVQCIGEVSTKGDQSWRA